MSELDKTRFTAKHPLECSNGHRYTRSDGFFNWLLTGSQLGSALILADTAIEGRVKYDGDSELGVRLPYSLRGAEISAWPTSEWKDLGGDVDYAVVWKGWAFITLKETRLTRVAGRGVPATDFQIVGSRRAGRIPGWRQAMGEAIIAFEEGRTNVSILLANIAVETLYSSIADRRLRRRGMTDSLIADLHGKLPFEWRLRERFARAFKLPCLGDAPFWADWVKKARSPRNPLAHSWRFERGGKAIATEQDAQEAIWLHLKAVLHLNPKAFDWLMSLETKAVRGTPRTA